MRERPQVREQRVHLGLDLPQPRVAVAALGHREPDRERQGDQALLCPVVQVALEPAPLAVGGLDYAGARAAQALELGAQLGLQALVVEREASPGDDRLRDRRVGDQARAVREHRERPPAGNQGCELAVGRRLAGPSGGVDEAAAWQAVKHLERGVAEPPCQSGLQPAGSGRALELDDQGGERGAGAPAARPLEPDRQREEAEGHALDDPEPEDVVAQEAAVGAVQELRRHGEQVEAGGRQHRRGQAPLGHRAARRAPHRQRDEQQSRERPEAEAEALEVAGQAGVACDEEEVPRAAAAALRRRIEEQGGQHAGQPHAGQVAGRHGGALGGRAEPSGGIRERGVGHQRRTRGAERQRRGEAKAPSCIRVVPLRHEPGGAGEREQRPEGAGRPAPPGGGAGRDERETGGELERCSGGRLAGKPPARVGQPREHGGHAETGAGGGKGNDCRSSPHRLAPAKAAPTAARGALTPPPPPPPACRPPRAPAASPPLVCRRPGGCPA